MHSLTSTFDLVQRVQGGDRAALELLAERYYERVRCIVRVRLGARLRRRLETGDILGEVFAKAIEIFDRFEMRDEGSMLRWLGQIAERRIRDEADKQKALKRSAAAEVPIGGGADGGAPDSGPRDVADTGRSRPEVRAQQSEDEQRLEAAMDRLEPGYREIILARDYEGLSWQDVAAATGRPTPDAARMYHAKATLQLTKLLQGERGSGRGAGGDA